jgi:hypothetical protein
MEWAWLTKLAREIMRLFSLGQNITKYVVTKSSHLLTNKVTPWPK